MEKKIQDYYVFLFFFYLGSDSDLSQNLVGSKLDQRPILNSHFFAEIQAVVVPPPPGKKLIFGKNIVHFLVI